MKTFYFRTLFFLMLFSASEVVVALPFDASTCPTVCSLVCLHQFNTDFWSMRLVSGFLGKQAHVFTYCICDPREKNKDISFKIYPELPLVRSCLTYTYKDRSYSMHDFEGFPELPK